MHRFNSGTVVAEAIVIVVLAGLVSLTGAIASEAAIVSLFVAMVALLTALTLLRWRRRFVVTEGGLVFVRGPLSRPREIPWRHIAEIRDSGTSGARLVIVGADGTRLRITGEYDGAADLMELVRRRAGESVVRSLEAEWASDGRMTFRHPGARLFGHVLYFLGACGAACFGTFAWSLMRDPWQRNGSAITALVVLGTAVLAVLAILRRYAAWRGARIMLWPGGVRVARLDGTTDLSWSDVAGADYGQGGQLLITRASGRHVRVPVTIANVGYLQHYLQAFARRAL